MALHVLITVPYSYISTNKQLLLNNLQIGRDKQNNYKTNVTAIFTTNFTQLIPLLHHM